MIKIILTSILSLASCYSYSQIQLDYVFRYPFMKDAELIQKNQISEIVIEMVMKDEVGRTSNSSNIHYVFDDFGRLVMEFKGESFKSGKLLSGEYALNINYATASNLPSTVECYRIEHEQLMKYTGIYHYDEQQNLIKYTSTQGNTIKVITYKDGKVSSVHIHSEEDSLKGKYKYEYPNTLIKQIHRWGGTTNTVSDKAMEHFELFSIQEFNAKKQLIKEKCYPSIGLEKVTEYFYSDNRLISEKCRIANDSVISEAIFLYNESGLLLSIKRSNFVYYTETIESIVEITFNYFNH